MRDWVKWYEQMYLCKPMATNNFISFISKLSPVQCVCVCFFGSIFFWFHIFPYTHFHSFIYIEIAFTENMKCIYKWEYLYVCILHPCNIVCAIACTSTSEWYMLGVFLCVCEFIYVCVCSNEIKNSFLEMLSPFSTFFY